ncbi:MAG: CcmD family protein [Mailhella sp.]|nr:CcmD family protein [Mailhella sp.]
MNALYWFAAANAALWIGLGAYLAFLGGRQRKTERRLGRMGGSHD